jgi:DNA-binding NtrC family response regulator
MHELLGGEMISRGQRKILIVDDDEAVRVALSRTLRALGYQVSAVDSGSAVLELLAVEAVDLVISDYLMPEMTGLELMEKLQERHPEVMRIVLTAHTETDVALKAIDSGKIYRFFTKPWDFAELSVLLHIAFEQVDLERQNQELLALVRYQTALLKEIRRTHPEVLTDDDRRRLEAAEAH